MPHNQKWPILRVIVETRVPPNTKGGSSQFAKDVQTALNSVRHQWPMEDYSKVRVASYTRKRPHIEPNRKVTRTFTEVLIDGKLEGFKWPKD